MRNDWKGLSEVSTKQYSDATKGRVISQDILNCSVNSLYCMLVLHGNFIPYDDRGFTQERTNMWVSSEVTDSCFSDLQGNLKGRVSCSSIFKKERCDSWRSYTESNFSLSTNGSSNGFANKGFPTATCTVQEDLSIVVIDRCTLFSQYISENQGLPKNISPED